MGEGESCSTRALPVSHGIAEKALPRLRNSFVVRQTLHGRSTARHCAKPVEKLLPVAGGDAGFDRVSGSRFPTRVNISDELPSYSSARLVGASFPQVPD